MKLLSRLAVKSLKLNKKRTIVTVLGIVLATALITSVATLVSSFQTSSKEYIKKTNGDYHYEFLEVPIGDVITIKENKNIEELLVTQNLGYGTLRKENQSMPIQLLGFSEEAMNKLGIQFIEGTMPQKENEIVISSNLDTMENNSYAIGTEVILAMEQGISKTYKIVGKIKIFDEKIEKNFVPENEKESFYYTIITPLGKPEENSTLNVYVRCKDVKNRIETVAQILGLDEVTLGKLQDSNRIQAEEDLYQNEGNRYPYVVNTSLVELESGDYIDSTHTMLYSIAIVIVIIIMITSIYCIKNSFDISITEKVKQYGMLSSIGATSKQIRKSVLYEAFYMGILSIPIGIALGLGLIYILLNITEQVVYEDLFGMKFIFSINGVMIFLSAVLSSLTIYFSARKSSKKASKVSPIEAIRSNQDIKIKVGKLKSPKWIKKAFGVGGELAYKNLKRNRKKYRTTVISIVISVSVFIAMTSFIHYAFDAKAVYYNNYQYNIFMHGNNYEKMKQIAEDMNVKKYSLVGSYVGLCEEAMNHGGKDLKAFKAFAGPTINILSIGEQEYRRFVNRLGLQYEEVKEKGILLDYKTQLVDINGRKVHKTFRLYDYQKGDTLKMSSGEKEFDIELAMVTKQEPMHMENNTVETSPFAHLIVSDEWVHKQQLEGSYFALYMDAQEDREVQKQLEENYSDFYYYMGNLSEQQRQEKAMALTVSIFLYGFIIMVSFIGVTNIFNTITTSMELRKKEFANLQAIGMTKKEFRKMISLESLFYIAKSLIISIPIGIVFSYFIYMAFSTNVEMQYVFPISGILISILAIGILIGGIMKYSLNKMNHQNIIETIRKDNI